MIRGKKLTPDSKFRKCNILDGAKQYLSLAEMAVDIFSVVLLLLF